MGRPLDFELTRGAFVCLLLAANASVKAVDYVLKVAPGAVGKCVGVITTAHVRGGKRAMRVRWSAGAWRRTRARRDCRNRETYPRPVRKITRQGRIRLPKCLPR